MTIVHLLERNAKEFERDIALVEINPEQPETRKLTWNEYELVQPTNKKHYRREISWEVFNEKSNRLANMLTANGHAYGDSDWGDLLTSYDGKTITYDAIGNPLSDGTSEQKCG